MKSDKDLYTELKPEEIWKVYRNVEALFRGGGNQGSPRLYGSKGVRARDFKIFFDHRENLEMVLPDKTKGLSFADSIERLENLPVRGTVWCLPKGTKLPKGLVINYKDLDHPLVNVEYKMTVLELMAKLKQLAILMEKTEVTIR